MEETIVARSIPAAARAGERPRRAASSAKRAIPAIPPIGAITLMKSEARISGSTSNTLLSSSTDAKAA